MNGLKRWTSVGLLLAAAWTTGCVAQVGQDNEDPGSVPSQLTGAPANAVTTAPTGASGDSTDPSSSIRVVQTPDGQLVVGPQLGNQQALQVGPGVDPGAPVTDDGDGREPDPHPWHGGFVAPSAK